MVSAAAFFCGLVLVVVGVALVSVPAALVVAGVECVAVGVGYARSPAPSEPES